MCGFRGMLGVWPAALTAGVAFAIPQFLVSNFHGPWLVDVVASITSIVARGRAAEILEAKTKFGNWTPTKHMPARQRLPVYSKTTSFPRRGRRGLRSAFCFSPGEFLRSKKRRTKFPRRHSPFQNLHNVVVRTPPVVPTPTAEKPTKPEEAVFRLNWLSATGTSILIAALLVGLAMKFSLRRTRENLSANDLCAFAFR